MSIWRSWVLLAAVAMASARMAPGLDQNVRFGDTGYTEYGTWESSATVSPAAWKPGEELRVDANLIVSESHLAGLAAAKVKADGFCLLVTAERTFDSTGWLRLASDERMSTLLTPTGLPIEGGVQGAVTNRFGYGFRTPVDELVRLPLTAAEQLTDKKQARFEVRTTLPAGLPPGIYRVRLDFGVTVGKRFYSLNGEAFTYRPFFKDRPTESHLYSPPLRASGANAAGQEVNASEIQPRIPWVLLGNYNSNGYRGVVAEEDRGRFGLSGRNLIQDDVILPMYDAGKRALAYSLEPQFPADTIEARSAIPWNFTAGELSIQITGPDGKTQDLGAASFVGKAGQWPTTKNPAFTAWKPAAYGRYTVRATGWTADVWGNRYEGGGTYSFWIANRMTMATATFQGYAFPVGSKYGRDLAFAPAVPADVEVVATFFPSSDPAKARTVSYKGKASSAGIFFGSQAVPLLLDAPGEYSAYVLAQYTDRQGQMWVSSMRHAGVVYPDDSPIVARGKKLTIGGKLLDRGETRFEGYVDENGENHLAHINFPYQAGDVLLIASEGQGANKIEPVLLYESKEKPAAYNPRWQGIGVTNVRLQTSNGYSPHLFPEYITDWAYYYASAARPGFMGRFLVAEDGTRAPYWPTSPNSFGGQINATSNGDLPGDIYRLMGGVVVKPQGAASPLYAGYLASAFLLPKDSKNNRVIAPGSEDLIGSTGDKGRLFLVGTRPGIVYETGTPFRPAVQIDPILPALVTFVLDPPTGPRRVATATGDRFGTALGPVWTLDEAGLYRFYVQASWEGHAGLMPGMPKSGGDIYVIEKGLPPDAPRLQLDLPAISSFRPTDGLRITGTSSADEVYYAAVIPGAVIADGLLPVVNGKFEYFFDPKAINFNTPTYDIANRKTGKPEIGEVVHLTFFSKEQTRDGSNHSFVRVILRGTQVIYQR